MWKLQKSNLQLLCKTLQYTFWLKTLAHVHIYVVLSSQNAIVVEVFEKLFLMFSDIIWILARWHHIRILVVTLEISCLFFYFLSFHFHFFQFEEAFTLLPLFITPLYMWQCAPFIKLEDLTLASTEEVWCGFTDVCNARWFLLPHPRSPFKELLPWICSLENEACMQFSCSWAERQQSVSLSDPLRAMTGLQWLLSKYKCMKPSISCAHLWHSVFIGRERSRSWSISCSWFAIGSFQWHLSTLGSSCSLWKKTNLGPGRLYFRC